MTDKPFFENTAPRRIQSLCGFFLPAQRCSALVRLSRRHLKSFVLPEKQNVLLTKKPS